MGITEKGKQLMSDWWIIWIEFKLFNGTAIYTVGIHDAFISISQLEEFEMDEKRIVIIKKIVYIGFVNQF